MRYLIILMFLVGCGKTVYIKQPAGSKEPRCQTMTDKQFKHYMKVLKNHLKRSKEK